MPRAAFSQVVNRSMSEVLTRSLITGLSTVFLVTVLYIFGGATLKDFAFAMMVGVLSGAYSSIFIASPVLTHWKEREPAYRSRRARIMEAMGRVPTFPEDNVVARVDDGERREPVAAVAAPSARGATAVAESEPEPEPAPEPLAGDGAPPDDVGPIEGDGAAEEPDGLVESGAAPTPSRPPRAERQRKRRQQRSRRKHGRNR
jgi:SecD/SecF fusion protein